ncbi:BglG family transcription antiterminator [Brevibacillus fulvus]|uniref:Lichenan operon transcriptional antiterminator n=1 Tax=Brevibacillus fulvus TaxID=1125967 RepID=A0A938XTS6_9BACL|nr:BglG family transcription antiterminator [Brevibacillus fulvus]MBM7590348.1 lichenan operon transcriptional antiterminator [Brevibacillus fulvus]
MLTARMSMIVRELLAADTTVTSEYLARVIQVTSRTVRNELKDLDQLLAKHGAAIKSVRGTGYQLVIHDQQQFRQLLKETMENQHFPGLPPNLPEERVQYLIKRLLFADGYIKLEALADELFISKSTLQNDLRAVKKLLQSYEITLEKRPNYGLKIKGEEMKLRFCMAEYLGNRTSSEQDLVNSFADILSSEQINVIRQVILEHVQSSQISLSDVQLQNLIVHIAIACKRIQNGNHVALIADEVKHLSKSNEYQAAAKIVADIEKRLEIAFPAVETAYIAIHLLGTKILSHPALEDGELQSLVDQEILQLGMEILEVIDQDLGLGIKHDRELLLGICLHLKPAINRHRFGMNLRNPMLDAIKSNYPVAFEAAVLAGVVLKRRMEMDIHENELGYLALHIGAAMERKKLNLQPKRCIIVCASGVGSARLLYYKLKAKFGGTLDIVGTTEYYKLAQVALHDLDFVISTIPISMQLPIPIIQVNAILGDSDLSKIESAIGEKSEPNGDYLRPELVFLQQKLETREEVLRFLTGQLQRLGLVDDHFLQKVWERERVSPTCFGNLVAIPHPITPQTDSTFWAICTLQKPIIWEEKRVQLVCLLCVQKNSSEDLQKMYKLLATLVDDSTLVQQLLKCKSYASFLEAFYHQGTP